MVHKIFPTHIYVKDYDLPDEWTEDVRNTVKSLLATEIAMTGKTYLEVGNDTMDVFTNENMESNPRLRELRTMFVDGFEELAKSFPKYEEMSKLYGLDRDGIEEKVNKELGRVPLMKKGDYKEVHNHIIALAVGIFYLDDVDNERLGGTLVARDPSFNSNAAFSVPHRYPIETKKNRLVILPAHVWHEVTPYIGEERNAVILNLNWT